MAANNIASPAPLTSSIDQPASAVSHIIVSQNPKEWVARIDDLKRQIDAVRPLSQEQEKTIFSKFRLDWTFHSNAIEGNQLSEGETRVFLLEGLTAQGKPLKDYLDLEGHNDVIDYLLDFIHRQGVLTEAVIREMHKVLLVKPYEIAAVTPDGKPTKKLVDLGTYKSTPNQVMRGKVPKVFTSPLDTPAKMGELMAWLRKEDESPSLHPVERAALFHHRFVSIHPFDDGNGRMSRILMNLLLMQAGYPPVVIKIQERERYFAALVKADANDPMEFVEFIAERLVHSMELFLRGARGESIDEVDDINMQIALFKKEMEQFPEPLAYSRGVYQRIFSNVIVPLLSDFITRSSQFDDLFRRAVVAVYRNGSGQVVTHRTVSYITDYIKTETTEIRSLTFDFRWEEFKKTPLDPFTVHVKIEIHFKPFVFELSWASLRKSGNQTFLYSAAITAEDIKKLAVGVVKILLESIEEMRTKAAQKK